MTEKHYPTRSFRFADWCEMRGVSRATGYRLIRDGDLRTYKVRGNRYVSAEADRDFIERKEAEAQT